MELRSRWQQDATTEGKAQVRIIVLFVESAKMPDDIGEHTHPT
jgi:hypothetical protein